MKELEGWGALFDRTPDGRILQRNFGGHRYPRLAHVGDRTGLEMIRTLQDHGDPSGHRRAHGVHGRSRCSKTATAIAGAFGYDRERGRFRVFKAKAVVLATGGVGRAFKITSNSWEYTGDGHALAYHAGAALQDMEFVQFHPTGMIWPPSVRGILVTEGVRGEGGVLKNSDGKRFMFDDIPDNYKSQTADNEEEGWRYTQGDKNARRPPELLTRDHVARMIVREVKEGRGSPHGGVFLDISWIKEKLPNAEEHIKQKLPSMYHQFKQLADIDITKEPMEIGPTTHYVMGGIRVDGDTQMSTVPGLFACGECAAGLARRQPARRQLAVGPASCSASAPASTRRSSRRANGDVRDRRRRRSTRRRRTRWRRSSAARRRGSVPGAGRPAGRRCRTSSASCARRTRCSDALDAHRALSSSARRTRRRDRAIASTTRAGTRRSTCRTC